MGAKDSTENKNTILRAALERMDRMEPGFTLGQAMAEAERCLLCHDAPCSRGCPCATDPAKFIRQLRFRNIRGAIRTIKNNNALGGACGVLCPSSQLCELECCSTSISSPIQIGKIQRALIEHAWKLGLRPLRRREDRSGRVAVVGSGPAGLSCAAELAKAGYTVTVFEAHEEPGGVIRYGVPAHRFDRNFLERELSDIRELGVTLRCAAPVQGESGALCLLSSGFDAVFLAHGLWEAVPLDTSRDRLPGLFSSIEFLAALRAKEKQRIIRALAGKSVAVVGGGSVAMDCAQSALLAGARDVYLIYRRSWAEMPATEEEKIAAERVGVQFLILNQPLAYLPGPEGNLSGLKLVHMKLGDPDAEGRRAPGAIPGSEWVLKLDFVIEAIGNRVEQEAAVLYPGVKLTDGKLIVTDQETGATSYPGIFAGGDIVRGPSLVVQAVGDGKAGARGIARFLEDKFAQAKNKGPA